MVGGWLFHLFGAAGVDRLNLYSLFVAVNRLGGFSGYISPRQAGLIAHLVCAGSEAGSTESANRLLRHQREVARIHVSDTRETSSPFDAKPRREAALDFFEPGRQRAHFVIAFRVRAQIKFVAVGGTQATCEK
jgi:hypothetical protein